jgi:adenylate kinase family enzyme
VQPTIVALIGKPLAGKDTQADRLVAHHPAAVKISTGHIIRGIATEGETHRFWPIIGPYIPMMEQGLKLPDPPILAMLGAVIQEQIAEGKTLLVVAGSPRSMEQLDGFDLIANDTNADLRILHLDTTDSETYRRSASRNEGRVDDTPDVHAVRLAEFDTYVQPVIDTLREQERIIEIDGMKPVEQVYGVITRELRDTLRPPEISLPHMARR